MREIKYRGYTSAGQWIYGWYKYCRYTQEHIIICEETYISHTVLPETVSEYIGLKDAHGREIYENDILKSITYGYEGEVKYFPEHAAFLLAYNSDKGRHLVRLDEEMCKRTEFVGINM